MIYTTLLAFIIYLQQSDATRCCQFYCSESACLADDTCQWLQEGVGSDDLIVDGIQCRSLGWGDCGSCCPQCPGVPSDSYPPSCPSEQPCETTAAPQSTSSTTSTTSTSTSTSTTSTTTSTTSTSATPSSTTTTTTTTSTTSGSSFPNEPGLPAPVSEQIAEDDGLPEGDCKKISSQNCWTDPGAHGQNWDYSPNKVSFTGVKYDTAKSACLYDYQSVKTDNLNCDGKSPDQSHLVFDIDCPTSAFTLTAANDGYIGYGLDGSTCFWGIKIDEGCGGTCNYTVAIQYSTLAAGVCPYKEGWMMDKASNVFSFNSLDGIPTCTGASAVEAAFNVGMIEGLTTQYMQNSRIQTALMVMMVLVFCGAWLYWRRDTSGEYKQIYDKSQYPNYQSV
eukprot:504987_1